MGVPEPTSKRLPSKAHRRRGTSFWMGVAESLLGRAAVPAVRTKALARKHELDADFKFKIFQPSVSAQQ